MREQKWMADEWSKGMLDESKLTPEAPLVWRVPLFNADFCNLLLEEIYNVKESVPSAQLVC